MHKSSAERRRQQKEIFEKRTRGEKHPSAKAESWFHRPPYQYTMQEVSNNGR